MTARDDYPTLANHALGKLQFVSVSDAGAISAALDEIDRLRFEADSMRNMLADSIVVHQDDRAAIVRCHAEIDEVAGRIANGAAICCAPWRDTEARGWLWYCSLPLGHDGHHRRIGATW